MIMLYNNDVQINYVVEYKLQYVSLKCSGVPV